MRQVCSRSVSRPPASSRAWRPPVRSLLHRHPLPLPRLPSRRWLRSRTLPYSLPCTLRGLQRTRWRQLRHRAVARVLGPEARTRRPAGAAARQCLSRGPTPSKTRGPRHLSDELVPAMTSATVAVRPRRWARLRGQPALLETPTRKANQSEQMWGWLSPASIPLHPQGGHQEDLRGRGLKNCPRGRRQVVPKRRLVLSQGEPAFWQWTREQGSVHALHLLLQQRRATENYFEYSALRN